MSVANEPQSASNGEQSFAFGSLRLLPSQRLLLEGDKPVRLGSRALDILTVLVEHAGRVVPKEELIARVWPNIFVDESNLKMQVSALRRAVGDGQGGARYIVTVPGRGYEFVAPVRRREEHPVSTPPAITKAVNHNLPAAVTRMIGRDETVATLISRLSRERLVTIVGPGGIGKTTLALAVAEAMLSAYEHGVWFIDLAPLSDPRLVPSTVGTVLGLEVHAEDPLPSLVDSLRDKRMLLILDNCEHLIEAAVGLAAAIFRGVPGISLLATSREPLGVEGEREYRLRPLDIPSPSPLVSAAEALAFPAIQLFSDRVSAVVDDFALSDADVPLVVEICRRLDGLPLAIEFAAARVDVLGIRGVAARLGGSVQFLGGRRRAQLPRHRTMRSVLDWSYGLLSEEDRRFFRRLGIFSSSFSVKAAASVAMDAAQPQGDAVDLLGDLVSKSWLTADIGGAEPRFRLLETTRLYALEKLAESGEREEVARRHAEFCRDAFEPAAAEWEAGPTPEWLSTYGWRVDALRAALDWAFSPSGDASIGISLTTAVVPLWMHLSLHEETRGRVKQALAALAGDVSPDVRQQMKLYAALGAATAEPSEMGAALTQALELAERVGDFEYQLRALRGLAFYHTASTRFRTALPFAQRFYDLAASGDDPNNRLIGERTIGVAQHYVGNHLDARPHLERVLAGYVPSRHRSHIARFQTDLGVSARVFLARVLWLQGFSDQAVSTAKTSVEEAQATGHTASLCYALAMAACPIAHWVNNTAAAQYYTGMLLDHSRQQRLPVWSGVGSCLEGLLTIKGGDFNTGWRLVQAGIHELGGADSGFPFYTCRSEMAEALGHAGWIADGLAVVEPAIDPSQEGWLIPELLRVKGEILRLQGGSAAAAAAEDYFRQALDWACRQGALSWELRAAMSLSRLWRDQGRSPEARPLLEPVYERFTEGFETADLLAAQRLLNEMNDVRRE